MTERPLADAPWLSAPETVAVLDALAGDRAETRFVGGGVRDALLGLEIADVDLATTLEPEETMRRLKAAGLKAVPTGLAHGTVTAVVDGHGFEITTLRRDVATDGRHAEVAFTDDWRADAARRDFTINAMSSGRDGRVFDYFGGRDDLAAGRVRFVGDAAERVGEDYLRILRFFRFFAWYGSGVIDADGLAACRKGVDGLTRVSAERMRTELLRLLSAPDPGPALSAMRGVGVMQALIGHRASDISELLAIERAAGHGPDPILRLAALAPGDGEALTAALRLSRKERQALLRLGSPWTDLGRDADGWRRVIYRQGVEAFRRRTILAASVGEGVQLIPRLTEAKAWRPKTFPVRGRDLIALGLPAGPAVGAMTAKLEAHWVGKDFAPAQADLLALAESWIAAEDTAT